MAPDRELPDRRTVLRVGAGMVVLAVAIGAGVIESRREDETDADSGRSPEAGPDQTTTVATTTSSTLSAPTTTITPIVPDEVAPGVMAVGSAYLALRPGEADLTTLMSLLPSPDGDIVAAARSAVSSDFARGRTVTLDGWVLALSEARAAAVLSICADSC